MGRGLEPAHGPSHAPRGTLDHPAITRPSTRSQADEGGDEDACRAPSLGLPAADM